MRFATFRPRITQSSRKTLLKNFGDLGTSTSVPGIDGMSSLAVNADLTTWFVFLADVWARHIYMHRFLPRDPITGEYNVRAQPIGSYPARCVQAAALMHMIQNNLDPAVAQFPAELVTYGGNGSAFSNWAQYHETMRLLSVCTSVA